MGTVYQEAWEDEFDYEADWKEIILPDEQPSGGAMSGTDQTATLVGLVPFHKLRSAMAYFIGYNEADIGAPFRLYRSVPAAHPLYPQLRCYAVGWVPWLPLVNEQALVAGVQGPTPSFNFDTPWYDPRGNFQRTASMRFAKLTVQFRSFGHTRFLNDYTIRDYRDEWQRFTTWNVEPQTEVLSADGNSQLHFAEGPPSFAGDRGRPLAFPVPVAQLLSKAAVTATILNIPTVYLSNAEVFFPRKWTERLGTVNSVDFFGHPAGTLLLTACKFSEVLEPVAPSDPDFPITSYTATAVWEQFDPEKGVLDEPPGRSPYAGHRVFPWRKDGKWYYCLREDNVSEMLPLADHHQLLQHVSDF